MEIHDNWKPIEYASVTGEVRKNKNWNFGEGKGGIFRTKYYAAKFKRVGVWQILDMY